MSLRLGDTVPNFQADTTEGPIDLYAWDSYPGGTCSVTGQVTQGSPAPDFGRPHPDLPHTPMPKPYAAED